MAHNTGKAGNSRNFGLNGGPGKGDSDRTSNRRKFSENFDSIVWTNKGPHPFVANPALKLVSRKGNRMIQKYS